MITMVRKKAVNVALVSLCDIENNAIRIIAALLRINHHKIIEIYFKNWINNYLSWPKEIELKNLIRLLKDNNIAIIGISVRASAYHKLAALITKIIKEHLKTIVVWGGVHPTLMPEKCLEDADIICFGEGEYPLLELANNIAEGKSIENIKNLWVKTSRGIVKNEIRPLIENLDLLPFRDYTSPDKFYIEGKRVMQADPVFNEPLFRMNVSRGCPYDCSFCYNSAFKKIYANKGAYFRYRSVENVIIELQEMKRTLKKINYIRFDDEVFLFNNNWLEEFVDKYPKKIGIPFECFLEPRTVREDYLSKLKNAGLKVVYMGIQNTERINYELYDRPTSNGEVIDAVKILHKLGLDARYQIMLDDPVSSSEDKRDLFKLLMSFPRPFKLYLFSMTVFPGTQLAKKLLEKGIIDETQIEGESTKTFRQLRVDLNYPRAKEDIFWVSLIVLISKDFIPKQIIYKLSNSEFLKSSPKILALFAQLCNILNMFVFVYKMTLNGKMSSALLKQWANSKSLITL